MKDKKPAGAEKNGLRDFQRAIRSGIPDRLPEPLPYDRTINHAPKRKDILTKQEKQLAVKNALRYFAKKFHKKLAAEFARELKEYGRIYMYRFRPKYRIYARNINDYPHKPCRRGNYADDIQQPRHHRGPASARAYFYEIKLKQK